MHSSKIISCTLNNCVYLSIHIVSIMYCVTMYYLITITHIIWQTKQRKFCYRTSSIVVIQCNNGRTISSFCIVDECKQQCVYASSNFFVGQVRNKNDVTTSTDVYQGLMLSSVRCITVLLVKGRIFNIKQLFLFFFFNRRKLYTTYYILRNTQ